MSQAQLLNLNLRFLTAGDALAMHPGPSVSRLSVTPLRLRAHALNKLCRLDPLCDGCLFPSLTETPNQLVTLQVIGILAIFAWVVGLMSIFFGIFKFAGIIRISAEDEHAGLDVSKHGGSAYNYTPGLALPTGASPAANAPAQPIYSSS